MLTARDRIDIGEVFVSETRRSHNDLHACGDRRQDVLSFAVSSLVHFTNTSHV